MSSGAARRARAWFAAVHDRLDASGPHPWRHLPRGLDYAAHVREATGRATSEVCVMLPSRPVRRLRSADGPREDATARGVRFRPVVDRSASPVALFASHLRGLRVGDVPEALVVVDRRTALVPGAPGTAGRDDTWATEDPVVVAGAITVFEDVWDTSLPALPEGEGPPLGPRTVRVALLLGEGASDKEIAATLGTSARTVSAEVRRVIQVLGARGRAHAVAIIAGADS